jgi:hypothetical protein
MSQAVEVRADTFSIGPTAFAAIGAYSSAILTVTHGWPAPLAIACGTVLAGIVSALMDYLLSHLRGVSAWPLPDRGLQRSKRLTSTSPASNTLGQCPPLEQAVVRLIRALQIDISRMP